MRHVAIIKVREVLFFFEEAVPPAKLPVALLGQNNVTAALSALPNAIEINRGSKCTPAMIGESPLTTWKRRGRFIMATK